MDKAKKEKWVNVTGCDLVDNFSINKATSAETARRSMDGSLAIFMQLFSLSMFDDIREKTADNVPPPSRPNAWKVSTPDIIRLVAMIVQCCGERVESWSDYLGRKDRVGLSESIYERLRTGLCIDHQFLFSTMSNNMHAILNVGGESSIDETMLPFQGDSDHIVFLPRKPHDTGIRLYLHCFQLAAHLSLFALLSSRIPSA